MEDKSDSKSKDVKANHNSHDTEEDTSETSPEQMKSAKKTKRSASSLSDEPRSSKRTRLQYQPFQSPTLHIPQLRPTKPNEEKQVVYVKGEFLALRNESGSYFICQAAQNVYKSSHRFRIRWLSKMDGPAGAPQKYSRDFYDHTDFECVLTNIQMERLDKNLFRLPKDESLRTETILKRAINLENGIHDAEPEQSEKASGTKKNDDDKKKTPKSVVAVRSTVETKRTVNLRHTANVNASRHPSSTRAAKSKLRKVILKSRLKAKTSKGSKVKVKQKILREVESRGNKKKENKVIVKQKPKVVTEKEKLKPNTKISLYSKDPTFESNNSIPFVSTLANSKLLIRAVLMKDMKTLQSMLQDSKTQSWVGVHRSVDQKLDALAYALLQDNHKAVELILNERQNSRKSAIKMPDTLLLHHTVGRTNFKSLGSVVREISLSRGGREGNSALMKDCYEELSDVDYINLLLRHGVSIETLDLFCSQKTTVKQSLKSIAILNTYRAVLYGHRHLAAHLIDEALKLEGYGFTNLHKQALSLDKQDLSSLRPDAATKRASGNCGITPIHCAAINTTPRYLKQLIDSEPDFNVGDLHLHKPIHYAAAAEAPGCLELLLSRGVKYDEIDVDGNTPLHIASETGRAANVELLLKRAKAEKRSGDDHKVSRDHGLGGINRPNRSSHTPLHLACIEGHLEVVRALVKHGADIEKPTGVNKNRITPLMLACQHGHLEIVKLLMMSSVKLEARDKLRRTGLTHAIINGHAHIASNLLRLGADPDSCDSSGNSLLHYAVAYGWWFCVKLLLDAVSSLNYTNDWKVTALGIAFLKGHIGLVKHLLSLSDIDVEFQDDNGMSIVMLAVCSPLTTELVELIGVLIHDKKAKCAISDIHGNTALHWLACNSIHLDGGRDSNEIGSDGPHPNKPVKTASLNSPAIKGPIICNEAVQTSLDVAKLLLDNGCDPSVRNHRGQTVLTLAIQQGNNELVKLLLNDGNQVTAEVDDTGENLLHALVEHSYETDLAALVQVIKESPGKKMKSPITEDVIEINLTNPTVPLVENVDGILRVGDAIIVIGHHIKTCEKFSVNLVQGTDTEKDDVALGCTVTVSGASPVLVCNSRTGGEWKKDTKEITLPPVCNSVESGNDVKTKFELTISIQEECFQVSVGELAAVEFPTDILPKQIASIQVTGNITLSSVQVQRSAISKAVLPSVSLPSDVLREMAQTYSYDGFTPLLLACSRYHFSSDRMHQGKLRDMIKTLVEEAESEVHAVVKKRSDNKSRDIDGYSALHFLANAKEFPAILDSETAAVPGLLLLLSYKPPINIQDHRGRTPLITAILSRQATAAKALIDAGADINLCSGDMDDDGRACPLILAAKLGLVSVIKLLLKHGANVQLADEKNHSTALHYAVTMKSSTDALEVVRCLVDAGININSTNQDGRTPLHLAVNANRGSTDDTIEVEDLLIERGGDLVAKDSLGRLPLHYAFVKIGKPADSTKIDPIEVVSLLTTAMKGLHLDVADHYGQTPLHCAAFRGATISCVHLAQSMSTLNAKDKNGNAALSLAVLGSHDSCAIMLLQKGANVQVDVVIPPADKLTHEREVKPTWQWKAMGETPVQQQRSPLLQEVVQKDWQGVMYMMLGQLQATGANYFPAIEAAVRTKKFKLAVNLIARGKNWGKINMANKDEQNLLHVLASVSGSQDQPELQMKVADILLSRGVQHNVPDKFGSYPITYAAMNRNIVLCNFFTERLGIESVVKLAADKLGRTPLSAAFWSLGLFQWRDPLLNDLREWCRSLCNHGATCNVLVAYPYLDNYPGESWASLNQTATQRLSDSSCHISPLVYAVCLRDYDLVAFLLQQGADINFPDENGRTPLMHAVRKNDLGMVKLLLNLNYCYKQDMWHYLQKRRLNKLLSGKELSSASKAVVPHIHSTPKLRPSVRNKPVRSIREELNGSGASIGDAVGSASDELNGTGNGSTVNAEETMNTDAMVDGNTSPTPEKDEKEEKLPDPVKEELKTKGSAASLTATDKHGWTVIHHLIRPFSCGTYDNDDILRILADAGAPLDISNTAGFSPLQMAVQSRAYRLAAALCKSLSCSLTDMPSAPVVELSTKDGVQWEQDPWDYKVDAAAVLERVESEAMEEGEEDSLVLPDVHSGMEEMGEVVMDTEQNIPYDVFMTKVDLSGGVGSCYSFFKMQVISQQGRNLYVLFTRWGKLGMEGEYQQTPHCSSDDAIREFCRNFKAKSGNNWQDVKNFQPIPRKYRLVEALRRGRRKLRDIPLNLAMEVPSKLPQPLKDLLRDLTHLPMLQEACQDVGIDTAVMPFERLCEAALQRGRQILKELKNVVKEKIKLEGDLKFRDKVTELAEKVIDLSSEYYQVVPQPGYIYEKVRPLERLQDIQSCLDSLEYMFDLELVSKILLGAQLRIKEINPMDYVYRAMDCQVCAMQEEDVEAQYILQYINNTSLSHRPSVEKIYRVSRREESTRAQNSARDDRYLLWHGISVAKLISVLTRGFPMDGNLGKPHESANKEIRFSDSFEMSRRMCRNHKKPTSNTQYSLLCEVSTGQEPPAGGVNGFDHEQQVRKLPGTYFPDPSCNLILSSGVTIPLGLMTCKYNSEDTPIHSQADYNEYVVSSKEQVCIRYIVCYRFDYVERHHKANKVPTHS